uniref:Hexosyltransferase n=1 Tax=Alexandrium monilatum TaxID=311494 RepID=A0A7S4WG90_9DINO
MVDAGKLVAFTGLVAIALVLLVKPRLEQLLRSRSWTLPPFLGRPQSVSPAASVSAPPVAADGPQSFNAALPVPGPLAGIDPDATGKIDQRQSRLKEKDSPQSFNAAPRVPGPIAGVDRPQSFNAAPRVPGPIAGVANRTTSGAAAAMVTAGPILTEGPSVQTAAPGKQTGVYGTITAHYDLVKRFFDESHRVHKNDTAALHRTMTVRKPFRDMRASGDSGFDLVNKRFNRIYPRTYHFAERFVHFRTLWPEVQPKQVKLLILTLTMSHEIGVREVHRRTWMSRRGICAINASTFKEPKNCRAFVTFAPGWARDDQILDDLVAREGKRHGDITRVDAEDPDATGKIDKRQSRVKEKDLAALLYAATHWPWITHIGKNDLDNYPQVDLILKDLEDPQGRRIGASGGVPPNGWLKDPTRPVYYGALMGAPPKNIVQIHGGFMQGQFYAISRDLTACVMGHLITRNNPRDYVYPPRGRAPLCSERDEGDKVWGCIVRWYAGLHRNCSVPWWITMRDVVPLRWHLCKP